MGIAGFAVRPVGQQELDDPGVAKGGRPMQGSLALRSDVSHERPGLTPRNRAGVDVRAALDQQSHDEPVVRASRLGQRTVERRLTGLGHPPRPCGLG